MSYSNSPLICYSNITSNYTKRRTHTIDTITPHMIVGQWTAKQGCDYFAATTRQVSANYVVGCNGTIGLSVPEEHRSWCTSNPANDHRAVTIEIASEMKEPYAVTVKAYFAVVELMADIALRNGITELKWKNDKSLIGRPEEQNITVHNWFSATNCPGTYIMRMLPKMVTEANKIIAANGSERARKLFPYLMRCEERCVIYTRPNKNSTVSMFADPGLYTMIDVSGDWYKLKSGAGWVYIPGDNIKFLRE